MINRRKFLGSTMFASTGWFLRTSGNGSISPVNKPIVISTWDFGKAANAAAWEILNKKGNGIQDSLERSCRSMLR